MAGDKLIDTRWNDARKDLVDAATTAGVDPGLLVKIAGFESGFNPHARPIAGHKNAELNKVTQFDGTKAMSSAYGYGQFLNATWGQMVRDYGEKYGIPNASELTDKQANTAQYRNDPKLQAGMLAEFTKANAKTGAALGGADAAANVYAMHNLGGTDGPKFLKALAAHPDARVDSVLSAKVIKLNESLYGDGSISISQAYKNMGAQMERYAPYAQQVAGQAQAPRPDVTGQHEAKPHSHSSASHAELSPKGRVLKEGMHGEDVRALQQHLSELGFKDQHGRPLKPDANFGPATKAAVEAFQAKSHLNVDGMAGEATLSRLAAQAAPHVAKPQATSDTSKPLLSDPAHPGNALYKQALDGMQKIDAAQGRTSDHVTSQVAGAVAAEAKAQGLGRIDMVALNADATRCWAAQGQANDPFKQVASVDLNKAINTPLTQSTAAWEQARQQQDTQAAQMSQAQGQDQQQAPTMQR